MAVVAAYMPPASTLLPTARSEVQHIDVPMASHRLALRTVLRTTLIVWYRYVVMCDIRLATALPGIVDDLHFAWCASHVTFFHSPSGPVRLACRI